ncbi:MAG: PKD domain-containing protein [Candidatus Heimdallarchaeota archaeon]|nr:PKD domain-containing protein [Candidatus Heimdallarchaeota archaeon]
MAVSKYATSGTAGALFIIGLLLTSMVYNDYTGYQDTLASLEDDAIFTQSETVYIGEEVLFKLKPALLSAEYGIDYFMWDFHDGNGIYVSTREDSSLAHTFMQAGLYLVSVLAMRGSISRIFTIPITVIPSAQEITILPTKNVAFEDEEIKFDVKETEAYTPILNFLWEFGDGSTEVGDSVIHNYSDAGNYTVRVRGYTNDSLVYTGFCDISIENKIPIADIATSINDISEDVSVNFFGIADDTKSDISSLKYVWEFGDGLMTIGQNTSHFYPDDGTYDVKLHVIDNNGGIGTSITTISVENHIPSITNIWNEREYYTQGETITTYSEIQDSLSDQSLLQYFWSIPGYGQVNSYPFFEVGNQSINLTVVDDNGALATGSTDSFEIINANPFISLIGASSHYNLSFKTWGTLDTLFNISLFQDGIASHNITLVNLDLTRNNSRMEYTIYNLTQPLYQYWDILFNSSNSVEFDNYLETTFSFEDHEPISLVNYCSSTSSPCSSSSGRFPTAPLDRGFPVKYNFSVFDPGNDNLTVTMKMGDTEFIRNITSPHYGPTTGTVSVTASLPYGILPSKIRYYITDEYGGSSKEYTLPIIDFARIEKPVAFQDQPTWNYFGYHIRHFAPRGIIGMPNEINLGEEKRFLINTNEPGNTTLHFVWHFGSGYQSSQRYPLYTYETQGTYLLWVHIQDDYYDHVEFMWLNATAGFPEVYPIVQGMYIEGEELSFIVAGLDSDGMNYYPHWDFGDGTTGFGMNCKHTYTLSGNYTVVLTLRDAYGNYDITEFLVIIYNPPPENILDLLSTYELKEGENLIIYPKIEDSPFDLLHLRYTWNLDGEISDDSSISIRTNKATNFGILSVFDPEGENFTHSFTYNITSNPLEIAVLTRNNIYGSTNIVFDFIGMVAPSIFYKESYRTQTRIDFSLSGKDGSIDSGTAEYDPTGYKFIASVNLSPIADEIAIINLKNDIANNVPLTPENSLSGEYRIRLMLVDLLSGEIISHVSSSLIITVDQDGDLITDELEIEYSNALDFLDIDYDNPDTDNDGIADPVEYVLGEDHDGDGLPSFYEDICGTSDENADTDGDGLLDGYGPNGELTIGSDPLLPDTDFDGLSDLEELIGWQIKLYTPEGLKTLNVKSDPTRNDSDGEGVSDYYEKKFGTDPNNPDTDSDGLDDLIEQDFATHLNYYDSDGDGINDFKETNWQFQGSYTDVEGNVNTEYYLLDPLNPDSDDDGLSDYDEIFIYESNAINRDSDLDGLNDSDEILIYQTNIIAADTDGDGLADGLEVRGFDIPIVIINNGSYDESGNIIKSPDVLNYTKHVTTDPNLQDTDGDGLTDYEELNNDTSNISDPTAIDSDGDGILDLFDDQKLISDYEPVQFISDIEISYSIQPDKALESVTKWMSEGLSKIWDLIKEIGNLIASVVSYIFYWKKVCFLRICVRIPYMRSLSSIANYVKIIFRRFVANNLETVFPSANNYNQPHTNSMSFNGFKIKTKASFPYLEFGGTLGMWFQNTINKITGILDPTVNIMVNIKDNSRIDRILVYRDGMPERSITNINQSNYWIDVDFQINKIDYQLQPTTFSFEIFDINGNMRELHRTIQPSEISASLLEQGITAIRNALDEVVATLEDTFSWAIDGIQRVGEAVIEVVETVVDFVNETYNTVKDWVKEQFDKLWEAFINGIMNQFTTLKVYRDRAERAIKSSFSIYSNVRTSFIDTFNDAKAQAVDYIQDSLGLVDTIFGEVIDKWDESGIIEEITEFLGPFDFLGDLIKKVINFISEKAMKILSDIIDKRVQRIIDSIFGQYADLIRDLSQNFISSFEIVIPGLDSEPDEPEEGFFSNILQGIMDILRMISHPAETLTNFLNSFSGEKLMEPLDKIFIDDPTIAISLNDLVVRIGKPFVIIGLAVSDVFSSDNELLNVEQFTANSVSKLSIEPDITIEDKNIVLGMFRILKIAIDEGVRFIEGIDRGPKPGGDDDIEDENNSYIAMWKFISTVLTDGWGVIQDIIDGKILGGSRYEDKIFTKDFVVFLCNLALAITQNAIGGFIDTTGRKGFMFDLIVNRILNYVVGIMDCVWLIKVIIETPKGYENRGLWIMQSISKCMNLVYDILSDFTSHGRAFSKTGVGLAVYAGFALLTVVSSIIEVIWDFIARSS